MMKRLLLIFLIFFSTVSANAEDGNKYNISLGSSYHAGAFDMRSYSLALGLSHIKKSGELHLNANLDYVEVDDITSIDKGSVSFGYDPTLDDRWSLWSFAKGSYDRPNKIDIESSFGGGIKYRVPFGSISYGLLSYEREYESGIKEGEIRHSWRLKAKNAIYGLKAKGVLFYQPRIDNFNDYIADGKASLAHSLRKRLDFVWSIEGEYRSASKAENKGNVLSKISFVFKF